MTISMQQAYSEGYARGWADVSAAMAARVLLALSQSGPLPVPEVDKILCHACQEPMVLGQAARMLGMDVAKQTIWEHQTCPPKIWTGQAPLSTPAPAREEGEEDQEQDEPEHMQLSVKQAFCSSANGQDGGPYAIIVRDTDGQWIKRIELPDWTEFRPASAAHRLTEEGWRVLPQAMMDPTKVAGWTQVDRHRWSAPIIAWMQEPELQVPVPLEVTTVDSDSGSGYQLPKRELPKRVPGRSLAEVEGATDLELVYSSQDDQTHTVTYTVTSHVCQRCQSVLSMVMGYDPSGQWLRSKLIVCQNTDCGQVTNA